MSFKALNPASFFQRISSLTENGFVFDTSTRVTSTYRENSVVLCLDFSCSMRELDYVTGNTYTESLLSRLPSILCSLFRPWSGGSADLDLSTDFKSRYAAHSIHLTVLAFGEHFANCLLFDHEVTAATATETAARLVSMIRANPSTTKPPPDILSVSSTTSPGNEDLFCGVVQQALHLLQQTSPSAARSLLLVSRGHIDVDCHRFHSLLLLLLQGDIPLWTVCLPEMPSPDCFAVSAADDLRWIGEVSGGGLLTPEVLERRFCDW